MREILGVIGSDQQRLHGCRRRQLIVVMVMTRREQGILAACFTSPICLKGKIKNKNCFIGFALMAKQPEQSGHENWSGHQGFTNRTGP